MPKIKQDSADKVFKTFPEFSQLTLNDRKRYEALTREYPPIADLSFGILMTWWNELDNVSIALCNNNLVISYWLPGAEDYCGLSIIGTNKIDETICSIFDRMRQDGQEPCLVNVPEFVIENMQHPELFNFKSMRSLDEYVVSASKFYPLSNMNIFRRNRVKSFVQLFGERNIAARELDLADPDIQNELLDADKLWPKRGLFASTTQMETNAARRAILHGAFMNMQGIGIYVRGELKAYCLFQRPADRRYVILDYFNVDGATPKIIDYLAYSLGRYFAEEGIIFANVDSDWGRADLRAFKLALGPVNYFRKYEITPAK